MTEGMFSNCDLSSSEEKRIFDSLYNKVKGYANAFDKLHREAPNEFLAMNQQNMIEMQKLLIQFDTYLDDFERF